jgi:hypothetical protein
MQSTSFPRGIQLLKPEAAAQVAWYGCGALVAFLLPFVFSSTLELDHDLYYLLYFAGASTFLAAYVRLTGLDLKRLFTRNWRWSLGLGVLAAIFLVFNVLNREDATPHPNGLYFAFTIAWRGVLYGVIDALLLTAFPVAVATGLLGDRLQGLTERITFAVVSLALVLVITAIYHLGYRQFRDDGIGGPEMGNTIISVPALLTANPLGSVVAHASMHVAADTHAYETDLFLPPHVTVD